MGLVQNFFDDLKNYLSITANFSGYEGVAINENEQFTMKVKIANTAPATGTFLIAFRITDCWVHKTYHAVPLDEKGNEVDSIRVPINDNDLIPGVSPEIESEVRMKAKMASIGKSPHQAYSTGKVARIQVTGKWVPDFTLEKEIRKDISPS